MKVLVIGSGGREHAICWKLAQSKKVDKLYCAPGNAGISQIAERVDINAGDTDAIVDFAKKRGIGLTVVGPEAPLTGGIADAFNRHGLRIFGPDKKAAELEGSKIFAKETMAKFGLPTAGFEIFAEPDKAKAFIGKKGTPLVVKADGLCAGKGVVVARTQEEALSAVDSIMVKKEFGDAGNRIIIEDCLQGEEASVILISDGKDFLLLPSSRDHKRAFDNDKGPNTGGMGAYSPASVIDDRLEAKIKEIIVRPLIEGLNRDKSPYKGVLYIGLMIVDGEPYILEFNVRLGDPEAQVILPRIESDIVDAIEASVDENLSDVDLKIDKRACVCVVCASGGYPGIYRKGLSIKGLDEASGIDGIMIFHAGTKLTHNAQRNTPLGNTRDRQYETSGGRVLGITALDAEVKGAADKAYKAVSMISFDGMHYRKDIASKALKGVRR